MRRYSNRMEFKVIPKDSIIKIPIVDIATEWNLKLKDSEFS